MLDPVAAPSSPPPSAPRAASDRAPTVEPPAPAEEPTADADGLVEADLLVEDVSIDGMCGVY